MRDDLGMVVRRRSLRVRNIPVWERPFRNVSGRAKKKSKVDEVTDLNFADYSRSRNLPEKSRKTAMEFYWSRAVGIVLCNMIREY